MWRLPRPLLVFWQIKTSISIMFFLIIVVIYDYTQVPIQMVSNLIFLLIQLLELYYINFTDWNRVFLSFLVLIPDLILTTAMSVFFLVFAGFIYKLGRLWNGRFKILVPRLRIFSPWISHKSSLERGFCIFCKLLIVDNTLVHFLKHWGGKETSFSLSLNDFLY